MSPPQIALLRRLASAPLAFVLCGREHLTANALQRLGLVWVAADIASIRIAGRQLLARIEAGTPDVPIQRVGTRRVGIRLPLSVQPCLDRGRELHGTDTAAIVLALKITYPATS